MLKRIIISFILGVLFAFLIPHFIYFIRIITVKDEKTIIRGNGTHLIIMLHGLGGNLQNLRIFVNFLMKRIILLLYQQ